ncbi:phosphate/phosphite/phosphonate ABC transporter substrate-binding protein [Thalassotalea euphylliae]|uniref:Phosphate/phosphite/phosphonate ABC transporter substrate-binding protein n=1 Tax=Thalassotalea euphylliae TaxID=1655234 RepID=A0A3E0TMV0_9GAMM|nr:phosphate/phosphite/phosphonate ABC transporter substrate-binding protein [Thalassotalea euphylliae]REL25874.1 phosphate/phosphite/phosphonate ABC transporter substrate-binding protein [Thalassotalea euphylliae]
MLRLAMIAILVVSPLLFFASEAAAKPFVISKVSDNPKKHYAYLKPMADYLAKHLSEFGYTEGQVLMAKNNKQMIRYLRKKKVDLVTETIFSSVVFQDKAGAEFLVKKWKKGQRDYEAIIFARKDSNINTFDDFKGKVIAFEDPGSTSAFFVPAAMLLTQGLKLEKLESIREQPYPDSVGYVFSNEEINTSTWVHKNLVQIGALNDHDWHKSDHLPKSYRDDFKIIAKSQRLPRAIELVRPGMSDALKDKLKALLLNMHNDPSAATILAGYQRTTKFEEFDDSITDTIAYARNVVNLLKTKLD